jgi:hypothetical protein
VKLLEITSDLAICPRHVIAVQRNVLGKSDTCTVFLEGQDMHSGFTIEMSWEEAVDAINSANAACAYDETDYASSDPTLSAPPPHPYTSR